MNTVVIFIIYMTIKWMVCEGLSNNLGLTPPMGWTTWERFRCNTDCENYPNDCISEWLIRSMAEKMVSDGYLACGYKYIIIDDCWLANKRDPSLRLQPDPKRFPSGIKQLSNYIHSLGLKFGIYENYGVKTCEGYPGMLLETMLVDAKTFVEWEIDYIKVDSCFTEPIDMIKGFEYFGNWLACSKRPIFYSCSWPYYQMSIGMTVNYSEAALMCNSWRVYKDIEDSWNSLQQIINFFGEHQEQFASVAGPGRWNDPDMLIVGNFGLSFEQAKVQMVLWAILAAPLIMSNDLRTIQPEFKAILQNRQLIEINQDPLGIQGKRVYYNEQLKYEVWTRPLIPFKDRRFSWAIAIINLSDNGEPAKIKFPMKYTHFWNDLGCYEVIDVFDSLNIVEMNYEGELLSYIPPTGVRLYKAILKNPPDVKYKCAKPQGS